MPPTAGYQKMLSDKVADVLTCVENGYHMATGFIVQNLIFAESWIRTQVLRQPKARYDRKERIPSYEMAVSTPHVPAVMLCVLALRITKLG